MSYLSTITTAIDSILKITITNGSYNGTSTENFVTLIPYTSVGGGLGKAINYQSIFFTVPTTSAYTIQFIIKTGSPTGDVTVQDGGSQIIYPLIKI